MKSEIQQMFDYLEREYEYIQNAENLPVKEVYSNPSDTAQYTNIMHGCDTEGTIATKMIYIDEQSHYVSSTILVKSKTTQPIEVHEGAKLTLFRTALNAAYAINRTASAKDNIMFLGGGRINLITAAILSELGYKNFGLVGGHEQTNKNVALFVKATGCPFNRAFLSSAATVVVSCTNNNRTNNLYTKSMFPACRVHVSSDTGYTLGESFRNGLIELYSDVPYHLAKHAEYEFPNDKHNVTAFFHGLDKLHYSEEEKGIYLYGNIIADIMSVKYRQYIYEFLTKIGL